MVARLGKTLSRVKLCISSLKLAQQIAAVSASGEALLKNIILQLLEGSESL